MQNVSYYQKRKKKIRKTHVENTVQPWEQYALFQSFIHIRIGIVILTKSVVPS